MTSERVGEALGRIEEQLKKLEHKLAEAITVPQAVTVEHAGRLLGGRSKSWVWGLIRSGELRTVTIGRSPMVPMTEILRIVALPSSPSSPPVVARRSGRAEAEKIRAALRKKR